MKRIGVCVLCCLWMMLLVFVSVPRADELATLTGYLTDPHGLRVPQVKVEATNVETSVSYPGETNEEGLYRISGLPTGTYRIVIQKTGFKTIVKQDIQLHVQDVIALNFQLEIGSMAESVTVEAGTPLMNTESATVSTLVDRQFAENLPMNGRSFQTLIQLTPGVVLTTSSATDSGQFSVDGQRASSNYWMVDGVSANIGIGANPGNGLSGALGSFSVQGGTNSLVSVDAMQEFRIQTSTYAPEFGRTPGGQISIVTRSGTNQFHGTAFDYFRNDALDANNWFADSAGLSKPEERQNDFGGTFSGPILKGKTFFFFSYEGLRLRLPQTELTTVPDLGARQNAATVMQPYLNAYPLPNGTDNTATGVADFNASFSDPSTLDAYSLRIDHRLNEKLTLFGRYNYSPSRIAQRGSGVTLNTVSPAQVTTQTATVGATWAISPLIANDFRFNYSRTSFSSSYVEDTFGGAVPLTLLPFPNSYSPQNASFQFDPYALTNGLLEVGNGVENTQRQINLVDNLAVQRGSHTLKFGVDFRRLSPSNDPESYSQAAYFLDVPSAETGNLYFSFIQAKRSATLLFRNLGVFLQDTWRATPRLTITYGLRWDVDVAPSSISGPALPAATNFNDLPDLGLAPAGTPPFNTPYWNVAPRLGIAYQLSQKSSRETVLRGGFGVFYDMATQEVGNTLVGDYPFGAFNFSFGGTFPLDAATAAPPPITPASLASGELFVFDPHLQLPYTLEWNVALEQALGMHQGISASYIGSAGRRLIQTEAVYAPNASISEAALIGNTARSDYNALQLQFQRRLSSGLQALASYTWSHSIDDASAGSYGNLANTLVPSENPNENRGPSDFDVRNSFSAGVTYDIPAPEKAPARFILGGWSTESIIQARSAPPVNVYDSAFYEASGGYSTNIRPDLIPGIPLYLYGPEYPGGKIINNTLNQGGAGCVGPFCPPPTNSSGIPLRQGNLQRNALRGFGATQWDFAVHRDFPLRESLHLQFRAEMFNVLNHPNFGEPVSDINNAQFGRSTQTLASSLNSFNQLGGGFSPLYQIGGPRSIQLALKLLF